jgi:ABC-type arginine/histidine transport system permease subunit
MCLVDFTKVITRLKKKKKEKGQKKMMNNDYITLIEFTSLYLFLFLLYYSPSHPETPC